MLECRAVSFRFPGTEQEVLRSLDFALAPGEVCTLLGLNGSGKSTLCRLLAGLYLPGSGEVLLDGLSTAAHGESPKLRRLVQLVGHDPESQVIGETVAEDVAFGLEQFGFDEAERASGRAGERGNAALEAFGILELRDRPAHGLSGGELQLARLAGSIAVEPRYLVLDEAVAMLDGPSRRSALAQIQMLAHERGMGVVLATHDLEDLAWAERVCWLDEGWLALDAPRDEALLWLAGHPEQPFELPAVLEVAARLRSAGWAVPPTLEPHTLVEAICASS